MPLLYFQDLFIGITIGGFSAGKNKWKKSSKKKICIAKIIAVVFILSGNPLAGVLPNAPGINPRGKGSR